MMHQYIRKTNIYLTMIYRKLIVCYQMISK